MEERKIFIGTKDVDLLNDVTLFRLLIYTKADGICHAIDYENKPVSSECIYVIKPEQKYLMQDGNIGSFRAIGVSEQLFNKLAPNCGEYIYYVFPDVVHARREELDMFRSLVSVIERSEISGQSASFVESLVHSLLILVVSCYDRKIKDESIDRRALKVLSLIETHYPQHLPLKFYADKVGLGEKRLSTLLLQATGYSFSELTQRRIVMQAKRLLGSYEKSVKEIAAMLGIADEAYFSRMFKKATSMTPREFRSSCQKDKHIECVTS